MADKKCRRCHECRNNSHHWIPNPRVGITESEPEWVCKHCPEKGGECPCCCGFGEINAPDGGPQCHICHGEGVLPLKAHRTLKDASEKAARSIIEQWDTWEADAEQEYERCRQANRVHELEQQAEEGSAATEEAARYRAALELIAQVRHVSGSAQGAFRSNLRIADAALAGADLRDVETVEAVANGTWMP